MKRFVTMVDDETAELFKLACDERGVSAYNILSRFIHKMVDTKAPVERRTEAKTLAIQRKQRALTATTARLNATCPKCGRAFGDCAHTTDEA